VENATVSEALKTAKSVAEQHNVSLTEAMLAMLLVQALEIKMGKVVTLTEEPKPKPLPLLTMMQIKTVTTPFREAGQTRALKSRLMELGVENVSDLSTRELQDEFLSTLKELSAKLPEESQRQTVLNALKEF
jgi:hypothetical protein